MLGGSALQLIANGSESIVLVKLSSQQFAACSLLSQMTERRLGERAQDHISRDTIGSSIIIPEIFHRYPSLWAC